MSTFDTLASYSFKADLFLKFTKVYKLIGQNKTLIESLGDKNKALKNKCLEQDTYFLCTKELNIDLTENRLRLLIVKGNEPRNLTESKVVHVKKQLKSILRSASEEHLPINSVDLLDILKTLTKDNVKLESSDYKFNNDKKSVRYTFNKVLDDFDNLVAQNKYEQLCLSTILIMEAYNMKPYNMHNNLMVTMLLYYLLKKADIKALDYISFFVLLDERKEELFKEIKIGSVNYDQGVIFFSNVLNIILDIVLKAYDEFDKLVKANYQDKRAHKSDNIEVTIMKNLPNIFSKEDICQLYPEVSLSTITRVLTKLNEKKYIISLGKGRSAKWQKVVDPESYEYIVGGNDE